MIAAFVFILGGVLPQTPEGAYERAYGEYVKHDLPSAQRDFLSIVAAAPPALHSRYFLGRIALAQGNATEAVRWLEPAAAAEPPILDARAQLSKAYVGTGQFEKAREMTLRAIRDSPWDGSLHYRLGRIYQHLGQTKLMQQEFATSARLKSADQQAVIQLSECTQDLASGRTAEALEIRHGFLANAQTDPDALVALGKMFADAGLPKEALEPFQTAALRDSASFEAHYNLGLARLNLGQIQEAQAPLQEAARLLPQSREAGAALALAYVMAGRYAEAVPVLERTPATPRSESLLGLAYLRSGAASKAVPVLRRTLAASRDPKNAFLLMEALNATEDQAGALAVAETTAKRFPDVAQAHLAYAQQLARMGQYAAAGPVFEKALQLAPAQVDAGLGWAEALQKSGDYARSLSVFERVMALDSTNITAQLGAARNLIALRRFADARERLESAVAAHPENTQLRFELARVYAHLGDRERAAQQTRALEDLRQGQVQPQ